MKTTTSTSNKKGFSLRLIRTREQELHATVDTIERYLYHRSSLSWFEFRKKQSLDLLIKRAHDHIVDILKSYDESEKLS